MLWVFGVIPLVIGIELWFYPVTPSFWACIVVKFISLSLLFLTLYLMFISNDDLFEHLVERLNRKDKEINDLREEIAELKKVNNLK
jgi:hypothetical protein